MLKVSRSRQVISQASLDGAATVEVEIGAAGPRAFMVTICIRLLPLSCEEAGLVRTTINVVTLGRKDVGSVKAVDGVSISTATHGCSVAGVRCWSRASGPTERKGSPFTCISKGGYCRCRFRKEGLAVFVVASG